MLESLKQACSAGAQCGESTKMWKKYKNRKSATGITKVNLKNIEFTIFN